MSCNSVQFGLWNGVLVVIKVPKCFQFYSRQNLWPVEKFQKFLNSCFTNKFAELCKILDNFHFINLVLKIHFSSETLNCKLLKFLSWQALVGLILSAISYNVVYARAFKSIVHPYQQGKTSSFTFQYSNNTLLEKRIWSAWKSLT